MADNRLPQGRDRYGHTPARKKAATNGREQRWHPSQKIIRDTFGPDGGRVIATFELADTTEFKRWLLGFGSYAVVMTPRKLAAELKAEFREACAPSTWPSSAACFGSDQTCRTFLLRWYWRSRRS